MSFLVRGLLPIPGSSIIVRNIGSDLLSRRDISIKLLSYNILKMFCLISNLFLVNSKLLRSCSRLMVAPDELRLMWLTHRVISDRVHRLLVTLSYFRPDRFVQLLSLIPILILLLYYLVSGCLTRVFWFIAAAEVLLERQLNSKLNSNLSGAEITSNFSTYK